VAASLKNAYLQRDRAREHFQELKLICAEVCKAEGQAGKLQVKEYVDFPAKREDIYTYEKGNTPIPPRCSLLAGEILICLRAAMDYLVRNLGYLDSGALPDRTQFLIESLEDEFTRKARTSLAGLNGSHIAAIHRLQPFDGCIWTKRLAALTNLHKHNDLIIIFHELTYDGWMNPVSCAEPNVSRYKVDLKFTPTLYIRFHEEIPLIETLKEIESEVSDTLDTFEPEFSAAGQSELLPQ
jgi:hypothetical protein